MKVTIRPNLNTGSKFNTIPESTIHAARLGSKLGSVHQITIECVSTVVRPAGQKLAENHGEKTVHAGLIGYIIPTVQPDPKLHPRVNYAPHRGDEFFTVNGVKYDGGGIISSIGHKYYLIS
jgi:hypothetical protein